MRVAVDTSGEVFGEQDIADLLCMPQVLVDLIEGCLDGANTQTLAEIVLQDAALAAKIISAASKAGTEPPDPFEPISSAIDMLGVPLVSSIALQSARQIVRSSLSDSELVFQYGLWFASRAAGTAARCLAPSINYSNVEEAQLSGLLLNLGIHAFFRRYGDEYATLDVQPWSSSLQCELEESRFKTDHLQVADDLISRWQLDSFLADAVRFLHADVEQIEQSTVLLKIARLAQQFTRTTDGLDEESGLLAQRLFGLKNSETAYLFEWARGLCPFGEELLGDNQGIKTDFDASVDRLTVLIFTLADQEAARARLAAAGDRIQLIQIARRLYLENSPATDAYFFLLDQKNNRLTGMLAEGQPRLVSELKIALEESVSLVSTALLNGEAEHSFDAARVLTVTDHLLNRLGRGAGFYCFPFIIEGRPLGAVVLGLRGAVDLAALQSLKVRMIGQLVSDALAAMAVDVQDRFGETNSLLRRVNHEVNNPLTIIGNYAEVLHHLHRNDEHSELAESIKKEVRRIDEIISYYLNRQDLAGFSGDSIDLNRLLEETIESLSDTELRPRDIAVQLKFKSGLDKLPTNPTLVQQVVVNLIKNAAEAIGENGKIVIYTRESYLSDGGRHAEIVVHDSGPGIEGQVQEKLFSPVVSTKGGGHAGVGLSIVKGMVDDLGGRISCHSSSDTGTSFHLQIPYRDEPGLDH